MHCTTTHLSNVTETTWKLCCMYTSMWIIQTIVIKHVTADIKFFMNMNAFHRYIVKVFTVKIVCWNYNPSQLCNRRTWQDVRFTSSYRDDMNLVCWKLDNPQAEHNGWGLFVSNPLLKSNALSILWVHLCWLYLLAVDNKPRRIAHAAIFL